MTTPELPPVSAAHVLAIRQRVNANAPLDSLIQELARQQATIEDLSFKLRTLRAQQALSDLLLPLVAEGPGGLTRGRVDAGMPLEAEKGFYAMEYDGSGQPFRWTGPGSVFTFDLHLDRSQPLRIELHIAKGFGEASDELRAFSDGIELPMSSQPVVGGTARSLVLMPRATHAITRLSVMARKMFKPDVESMDQRTLGVVFRALEVEPADAAAVQDYFSGLDDLRRAQTPVPLSAAEVQAAAELLAPPSVLADPLATDEAQAAP